MSKANQDLMNQLKASLTNTKKPESSVLTPPAPVSDTPPPQVKKQSLHAESKKTSSKTPSGPPKSRSSAVPPKEKSTVVSVTLYPRDLDHIDKIIDYMRDNQRRITRSEAIKLALRGAPLNKQMIELHPKIQGEDGRRK